jgi:hypothetical protein
MADIPDDFPGGVTKTEQDYVGWKFLRDCHLLHSCDFMRPFPRCIARMIIPKDAKIVRMIDQDYYEGNLCHQSLSDVCRTNEYYVDKMEWNGFTCFAGTSPVQQYKYVISETHTSRVNKDPTMKCERGLYFYRTREAALKAALS